MAQESKTPHRPSPRYYDQASAREYAHRSTRRHRAEEGLLTRLLAGLAPRSILDVPCGTGRLHRPLAALGSPVYQADLSPHMLHLAGGGICATAARLPFRDRSFDLVLSHRFLHHLPPEHLPPVLAELARVADRYLAVSFFHPVSLHGLTRRLECLVRRRRSNRYPTPPRRLRQVLAAQGMNRVRFTAQSPYLRELWLALFRRQ